MSVTGVNRLDQAREQTERSVRLGPTPGLSTHAHQLWLAAERHRRRADALSEQTAR
jgi:hypothetical protein